MKTTASLLSIAASIAAPVLAATLIAHGAYFTEIVLGSHSITGLLAIAVTDYSPRHLLFTQPKPARKASKKWVRHSIIRPANSLRTLRTEKTAA